METKQKQRDAVARCKRILFLVDEYVERKSSTTRHTLRMALMDEFERAPAAPTDTKANALPENWKVREAVNRKRGANMISDAAVGEIMNAVRDLMPSTAAASVVAEGIDTPELRRLVNEYRHGCDMVQGHAVPQWRNLIAYLAAHPVAGSPAEATDWKQTDWKQIVENVVSYQKKGIYDSDMAMSKLRRSLEDLAPGESEPMPASEAARQQRIDLPDGAWLSRVGPLNMWALYRVEFVRMLNRLEVEFVDAALAVRAAPTDAKAMSLPVKWDGTGLPPVGAHVHYSGDYHFGHHEGIGKVVGVGHEATGMNETTVEVEDLESGESYLSEADDCKPFALDRATARDSEITTAQSVRD